MTVNFYKYQGTGNDFVMIDNRTEILNRSHTDIINHLCDRRFGIGADGLILLQNKEGYDFEMVYFNADGNESTMCGNGGRCTVAFAKFLGIIGTYAHFLAIDGDHDAMVEKEDWVELKMGNVHDISKDDNCYVLNTGSPHYVKFVEDMAAVDVYAEGKAIRYNDTYKAEGINVNFVKVNKKNIEVATYERGVENETLSCGTGVTAAAIAAYLKGLSVEEIPITTKGGNLSVRLEQNGSGFKNIWLCGAAKQVFKGQIEIEV